MSESAIQAAAKGDLRMLRLLIRTGHMEDEDEVGNTPLMIATKYNRIDAVKLLLERNANANHQNKEKDTAMHIAVSKGIMHVSVIRLLYEFGADPWITNANRETTQSLIMKNPKLSKHSKLAPLLLMKKRGSKKSSLSGGHSKSSRGIKAATGTQKSKKGLHDRTELDMSADDMLSFEQVWETLTSANPGTLQAANLAPFFRVLDVSMTQADYAALLDLIDVDHDGTVDFEDFYRSMMWQKYDDLQEAFAIDKPFDALDTVLGTTTSTGVITRSGYQAAAKIIGPAFNCDVDRDTNRIMSSVIPNYSTLVKNDAHIGIDKKLFTRLVSGKADLQALQRKALS